MFSLNGCIEVFGIQAEPQPPVLLAAVNKAVDPLCRFTFSDLCYNVTVNHLVQFPFDVVLEADWHTPWGMDNCWDIRVKYYVILALELSHSIEAFGILTDQVLFVLNGLLLGNCTVAGCGVIFLNRKVKCQQLQVGGSREAYYCWAWVVCDIEGCSSVFPFVGTRYGNSNVMFDL